ncbi:hypothetical protein HY571_02000 [Candidatus Micrarchaeota archaeon]|nr:hypothetical protein [Candidatus Micrarchaeota archaeon]
MALESIIVAGGSILLAVLITATTFLKWPNWLNYIWAGLALLWGILALL